jgi:hypothetical protein
MFIVPFFKKNSVKSSAGFDIQTVWVFLTAGGTTIWETEETNDAKCSEKFVIENYLTPNGFIGKVFKKTKKTLFFEINLEATNIDNFYSWSDFLKKESPIPDQLELFRPFLWIGDAAAEVDEENDWGWMEECREVSLGKFGTLADLWDGLREK